MRYRYMCLLQGGDITTLRAGDGQCILVVGVPQPMLLPKIINSRIVIEDTEISLCFISPPL